MKEKTRNELIELLEEMQEYFENKADVIDGENGQQPNEAMKFSERIEQIQPEIKKLFEHDCITELRKKYEAAGKKIIKKLPAENIL